MPSDASDACACCFARLDDDILVIGNDVIERRWRVQHGLLHAIALLDRASGREWLLPNPQPGSIPPSQPPSDSPPPRLHLQRGRVSPVEAPSLVAKLVCGAVTWIFQIFPGHPSVSCRLQCWPTGRAATATQTESEASGIEADSAAQAGGDGNDLCEGLLLSCLHATVHSVVLADRTDRFDNLATPVELRLSPVEQLRLSGCVFALEDPLTREGLILLKHAPLPHARPLPCSCDLHTWYDAAATPARPAVALHGHGAAPGEAGYAWSVACYRGGATGRIAVLQRLQRCLRAYDPARDGMLLSNTWGDRNRDGRICAEFAARELAAGAQLGVDVVQLDDGWQRGTTSNSVNRDKGGVWQGFWAADAQFWSPHPQRFPDGLGGTAALARTHGIGLGLWFAPDSAEDFANWQRDAEAVLGFWRTHAVARVKIDGVKAHSTAGQANLMRFFDAVLDGSNGAITFDLDVTAEVRPGYFGAMHVGPLFVENRYSDWHRWWPHATLRNLWQLAHWIDPVRLRMEFLNRGRNAELYAGDPLAPMACDADYIFAGLMVASPLAWFEVSELPEADAARLRPLIALWKQHRAALHGGTILPLGDCPSGAALTGFCSLGAESGYVIALRERNPLDTTRWMLPPGSWRAEVLAGAGTATVDGKTLALHWPRELSYLFVRLSRAI